MKFFVYFNLLKIKYLILISLLRWQMCDWYLS